MLIRDQINSFRLHQIEKFYAVNLLRYDQMRVAVLSMILVVTDINHSKQ